MNTTTLYAGANVEKLGYTVTEAAALTGFSRSALYSLMKSGELPYREFRRRAVLLRPDLERLLETLKIGGAA